MTPPPDDDPPADWTPLGPGGWEDAAVSCVSRRRAMTKEDDWDILTAMSRYGGSFVNALSEAAQRADRTNYAKLRAAFPDIWAEYRTMAALPARSVKILTPPVK
jgi:hypothetical protein